MTKVFKFQVERKRKTFTPLETKVGYVPSTPGLSHYTSWLLMTFDRSYKWQGLVSNPFFLYLFS